MADEFPKLVLLDADIAGGTGGHHFRKSHPHRFIQFGIAEQNMMAAAGGLAATGLIPVVTTFAVFCLRAIEQARLSIAYAGRNAKIVASHPGLDVGPDGGSAQALEDMAAFRAIPGMTVISPADPIETALATRAILEFDGPVYMRTGRSPSTRVFGDDHIFQIGKGTIVRDGSDVTIVACGVEVARAVDAAELLAKDEHRRPRRQHGDDQADRCRTAGAMRRGNRRHRHRRRSQHLWRAGRRGGGSAGQDAALPDRIRRRERRVRRLGRTGGTGQACSGSTAPHIAASRQARHRKGKAN